MVRAILEGRKTVTRRPVKGGQIPAEDTSIAPGERHRWSAIGQRDPRYGFNVFGATADECAMEFAEFGRCPYGKPGNRLWVRETHSFVPDPDEPAGYSQVLYAADGQKYGKNRPSIHMFRADSRILLEITEARVERLQDITGDQAQAEGVDVAMCQQYLETSPSRFECKEAVIHGFAGLWQSINGEESWRSNPWVWVVEFRRVTP